MKHLTLFSLLSFLLNFAATSAHAQNSAIDPSRFKHALAVEYAHQFADEFNAFQKAGDTKDIYGYFVSKSVRKNFFKPLKAKLRVRAEGSQILIDKNGQPAFIVEIDDLLEQRFKINGKNYIHDWNGNPRLQNELLHRLFKRQTARTTVQNPADLIADLFLPKAHAILPLIAAYGIEVCVDGGCELAWIAAQRAAIYVAANSPELEAATVAGGTVLRRVAASAASKATQATGRMAKYIIDDIRTDPEIAKAIAKMASAAGRTKNALAAPAFYIKAPFKAAGFLVRATGKVVGKLSEHVMGSATGFGIGTVGAITVNNSISEGKEKGVPWQTSLWCTLQHPFQSLDNCASAKPNVTVSPSVPTVDGGTLDDYWCPTDKVNEFQVTISKTGGGKLIKLVRIASDGENKGKPISALRYETTSDGNFVDQDSFRLYTLKDSAVTEVIKPKFNVARIPAENLKTEKLRNSDPKLVDSNMLDQVKQREKLLDAYVDRQDSKVIYKGDDLNNVAPDSIKQHTDQAAEELRKEASWAQDIPATVKSLGSICKALAAASTVPSSDGTSSSSGSGSSQSTK